MSDLTGDDLARPAKDLPLKVIRELGQILHNVQYTTDNWEMIAEELGYGYEEIKLFNTMSNARPGMTTPGERMMRDWVQRPIGRTLFVLHSALRKAGRLDCVEYLESEIYKRMVCMELIICVRYEDGRVAVHQHVTTRADSSLLESLHSVLEQPVQLKYKLLDDGVSWTRTLAREIKGSQLMLLRKQDSVWMEQDPTIDSSGIDLTITGDRSFTTTRQGYFANSGVRTSRVSLLSSESRTRQSSCLRTNHISDSKTSHISDLKTSHSSELRTNHITDSKTSRISELRTSHISDLKTSHSSCLRTNHITDLKNTNRQCEQNVNGCWGNEPTDVHFQSCSPGMRGTRQVLPGRHTVLSHAAECRSRSQSLHEETVLKTASGRLVGTSEHCTSLAVCNNLDSSCIKNSATNNKQNINISIGDQKVDNLKPTHFKDSNTTGIDKPSIEGQFTERGDADVDNRVSVEDSDSIEDNKAWAMDCDYNPVGEASAEGDSSEYRDFSEYRCFNECREFSEQRHVSKFKDLTNRKCRVLNEFMDSNEYKDPTENIDFNEQRDPKVFKHSSVEYKEQNENSDYSEYRDPSGYCDYGEYRDASDYRDPIKYKDVVDFSGGFDAADVLLVSRESEQSLVSETIVNEEVLGGDNAANTDNLLASGESGQSQLSETEVKQSVSGDDVTDTDKCFDSANYQYAENDLVSSDDSITMLKQRFCSSDLNSWDDINVDSQSRVEPSDTHLKQITHESVDESNVMCNSNDQYFTNDNSELDFNSETYSAHPDFGRDGKDFNVDSDMNLSELGLHNEQGAVQADTGNSLIKCFGETRTYLDFNKYNQGNGHVNGSEVGGDELGLDPVIECENGGSRQTFTRSQHRPPRRYISQAPGEMSTVTMGQQLIPYESLQRGMSCPSDFVYEKSLKFSEEHNDMVTIADVFSPVADESKMKFFDTADRATLQASSSSKSCSIDSALPKRHSLPVVLRPCQNVKKTKHERHTIHHCDKTVKFGEHFEQELARQIQDSPRLLPRGRRSELRTSTSDTILRSEMQSAPEYTRDTRYVCKIVIGGKTSRPPLDGLLANDKLFIHYNSTLQGFPGWSPRENENTIEKTMRDTVSSDGYYIIWYTRGRKTLVLSVSFRGSLVNYKVRTKVMTGKLHYYVTQGRYFEHVIQLLQHHQRYGVRAGGVDGDAEYRIKLGCPVLVQYERRPAVSV